LRRRRDSEIKTALQDTQQRGGGYSPSLAPMVLFDVCFHIVEIECYEAMLSAVESE
jgi:hypothetical protein